MKATEFRVERKKASSAMLLIKISCICALTLQEKWDNWAAMVGGGIGSCLPALITVQERTDIERVTIQLKHHPGEAWNKGDEREENSKGKKGGGVRDEFLT